jgi:hypothetical protein
MPWTFPDPPPLGRRFLDAGGKIAPGMHAVDPETGRTYLVGLFLWPGWKAPGSILIDMETGKYEIGTPDNPVAERAVVDMTAPSSVGCVLAQVREAWGDPGLHVVPSAVDYDANGTRSIGQWVTRGCLDFDFYMSQPGRSEAEALVAALEARAGTGGSDVR